jgi:hypothetical protein
MHVGYSRLSQPGARCAPAWRPRSAARRSAANADPAGTSSAAAQAAAPGQQPAGGSTYNYHSKWYPIVFEQ